ncbi:MAG: hypothetical protein H6765_06980 [Candidatus Peribacteria bacterium]|nr:MAG: hypothetical protein H6765_06980 [Candidatus Peribacteria bacterium]
MYERIYYLLDPEKHPSARFLDHLYAGIAQKKSELLQQKVEQRNEKLLLLQHLEAAQSDVLEDIDTYFEE